MSVMLLCPYSCFLSFTQRTISILTLCPAPEHLLKLLGTNEEEEKGGENGLLAYWQARHRLLPARISCVLASRMRTSSWN
ncbi:hypothetical protein BX666DRAFT_1917532 [Dichotomocladium elegans]|nr:hypothetical protein BX666DRAFT_1917532 [Dichotomocladium elegans]